MGHNLHALLNVAFSFGEFDRVPIMESALMDLLAKSKDVFFGASVTLELLSDTSAAFFATISRASITRPYVVLDAWFDVLIGSADYGYRLDDAMIKYTMELKSEIPFSLAKISLTREIFTCTEIRRIESSTGPCVARGLQLQSKTEDLNRACTSEASMPFGEHSTA
jgi:hypothetical protein